MYKHTSLEELKLYYVLNAMIGRCTNPNDKGYKNYGGRGISVCKEWRKNKSVFVNWALKNGYQVGLSIDRIDNDGNYEPNNCRFVDRVTQNRNLRKNITYKGEYLKDACLRLGGDSSLITKRMRQYGWTIERAFTTPVKRKGGV